MKNKKLILFATALVLAVTMLFTACANNDKGQKTNQDQKQQTDDQNNKSDSEKQDKSEESSPVKESHESKPTEDKEEPQDTNEESKVLNIYSSRHYEIDKEVYAQFEEATGIKVNVVEGKGPELLERLIREKDAPQADLFLTVGAETIYPLKQEGLLKDFNSAIVNQNVPENMRGDSWSAIMYRARIIAYEQGKTDPSTITEYTDLMKDEYKGKVLVRSSSSSYNVALLSSFIQLNGTDEAKAWAEKIVENMARKPEGNDRDQAKAVVAGEGDLAIMNSYYYVRMANSSDEEEAKVAEKVGLIFPKKTHINLSYAGLIEGGANSENAVKFIEFLTEEPIQKLYAEKNGEFPVNPKVEFTDVQKSWGEFEIQDINFEELGKYSVEATMIFDEVKWE